MSEKETKTTRDDVTIAVRSNENTRDKWKALQAEHPDLNAGDLFNNLLNTYADSAFIAQHDDFRGAIGAVNDAAESIKQQFAAILAAYDNAEQQAEDAVKAKIESLNKKLERVEYDNGILREGLKRATEEANQIEELQKQLADKDKVIADKETTIADKVSIIESHKNLEAQLGEALEDTRKLRDRIDSLNDQVAAERKAAEEQLGRADAADIERRVVEAKAEGLREKIASLEAALVKSEQQIEKAEAKAAADIEKATERAERMEREVEKIRAQMEAKEANYEDRITALNEQIAAKDGEIIDLLKQANKPKTNEQ